VEKDPWTRDSAGSGPWAPAEKGDIPVSTSGQGWEWSPDTAQGPARRPQTAGTSAGSRAQAQPRAPLPAPRASVPRAPLPAPRTSVPRAPLAAPRTSVSSVSFFLRRVLLMLSCVRLGDPVDSSPPGSSVRGIFQARALQQLPFPSPGHLADLGMESGSPAFGSSAFTTEPPGKPLKRVW